MTSPWDLTPEELAAAARACAGRRPVCFDVIGVPAPQGSKKVGRRRVNTKTGKVFTPLIESSKRVAPWRAAVAEAGSSAMAGAAPFDEPVIVTLDFWMPRPSGVKAGRVWPAVRPDVDKLARSTFDGLTAGGVVADDSRIVGVAAVERFVPHERGRRSAVPTGCRVYVMPLGAYDGHDVSLCPVLHRYEQPPTWHPEGEAAA